jgi:hypothetical protein
MVRICQRDMHLLQENLCPPHQLACPATATGREGGGGSQPGDGGGGTTGAASICSV